MKKADITPGTTYFTAKGRSYFYSEKKAEVIAVGAHNNSYNGLLWEVQAKLGYSREWVDEVRANRDLSENQKTIRIAELKEKVDQEVQRRRQAKPFTIDGKGSGILVRYETNYHAARLRDVDPEGFAARYPDYTPEFKRVIIDSRDVQQEWTSFVSQARANITRRAEAEKAAAKMEAENEVLREKLTAALTARDIENVHVSRYSNEVKLRFEALLAIVERIPTGEDAIQKEADSFVLQRLIDEGHVDADLAAITQLEMRA